MNKIYQSFTGEFFNSLDSKNRLNIPSKLRKALDPVNYDTFVLTKGIDTCLILYPLNEWKEVEEQLSKLSSIRSRDRNFVRSITRHAMPVQYDKQGRIAIPSALCQYAGIKKEVAIIGVIKKIELWDPRRLDDLDKGPAQLDEKSFEELADEINF